MSVIARKAQPDEAILKTIAGFKKSYFAIAQYLLFSYLYILAAFSFNKC
jgi:hypothetical protein